MPAKPITIGPLNFTHKGAAMAYLKDMLHRYQVGDKVNAADEEILKHALALHPEAEVKIGCGIASFSVQSADFGTKCFWISRRDGTTEKFSYKSCIKG